MYLNEVKNVLGDVLSLPAAVRDELSEDSPLLGSIPELDSMAVVNLITALEESFDIDISDDDISAATFETVGSLAQFVRQKLGT